MPVKSRTSTQQAYMKLLLVVAILICTDVAVADSTSELMEHRRLGGVFGTPLKWLGARTVVDTEVVDTEVVDKVVSFEDEWENAFRLQARQHLADSKKNTDSSLLTRELYRKVEWKILPQWKSTGETLSTIFEALYLNDMKTEEELYANPAFTTWMNFAFHLQQNEPVSSPQGAGYTLSEDAKRKAFISMLEVLQENMKEFKGLLKPQAKTKKGTNDLRSNKKLTELFQKWQDVYENQAPKHLPDTKTNTMSDTSANLYSKFLPALLSKIDSTSTIEEQVVVTLKVLRENRFPDAELVKMINAGFMDRRVTAWAWANHMESRLLRQWKSDGKTLHDLFTELKLNEAKTEMELYANPAFTTWIKFALFLQGESIYYLKKYQELAVCRSVLEVLEHTTGVEDLVTLRTKDTTSFEDLVTLRVRTEQGLQNPQKLKELYQKWLYVSTRQWFWRKIVNSEE